MTDDQKAPYEEMTRKDRERYEEEMQTLRAGKKATPKSKVGSCFSVCPLILLLLSFFLLILLLALFPPAYVQWLIVRVVAILCVVYFKCFTMCPLSCLLVMLRKQQYVRWKRMMTTKRRKKKKRTTAQTKPC